MMFSLAGRFGGNMDGNTSLYSFKSYQRGSRLQSIDENYQQGISYQDSLIKDKHVNMLVNFDIKNQGDTLVPRPGLKAKAIKTCVNNPEKPYPSLEADKDIVVVAKQTVHKGSALDAGTSPIVNIFTTKLIPGTRHGAIDAVAIDFASRDTAVYPVSYKYAKLMGGLAPIHNMSANPYQVAQLVGTPAWNNAYYLLGQRHDNKPESIVKIDTKESLSDFEELQPKQISPKDAVTYGYNMLSKDPYHFVNKKLGEGSIINFTGMLPYDADNNLLLTPTQNQEITFEAFYEAPIGTNIVIDWEWRSLQESTWNRLKGSAQHLVINDPTKDKIKCTFSPPLESVIIKLTAHDANTQNRNAIATLAVGFNFKKDDYGSTANIKPKQYNVCTADGMCYWKNRLVLWGVNGAENTLFLSDVNDPTYFPYPNNITLFDEDIVKAVPFGESLLVFTSSALYSVNLSEDGLYWTTKLLQNHISVSNPSLILTINNMVFFTAGNYFYMLVPKRTSTTGETVIASISESIVNFLDDFKNNVMKLIQDTYLKPCTDLELVTYDSFLDYEDIHVSYVFKTSSFPDTKINMHLIYNIMERNWRIYFAGTDTVILPVTQDLTQRVSLVTLTKVKDNPYIAFELLEQDFHSAKDQYITWDGSLDTIPETVAVPNWQRLDTGYREQASNFKKRYRELQFMLNNLEDTSINFYTNFFIDGIERQSPFTYQVVQDTNKDSPNYGLITVEKIFNEGKVVPGNTILAETTDQSDHWTLDFSSFPDRPIYKVRFPVSGKGYTPKLILGTTNEKQYELFNISWVYRPLYSR